MTQRNGCVYCLSPFSKRRSQIRHQDSMCRARPTYTDYATANQCSDAGSLQKSTTVRKTATAMVSGEVVHGLLLNNLIDHPAAVGAHKKLIAVMSATRFDILDLQESFDSAVMAKFQADNSNLVDVDTVNSILFQQITAHRNKFYMSHLPQIGTVDMDIRVVHMDMDCKMPAMFPVVALKKLCEHSSVRDLLGFDIAEYTPVISQSQYLEYYEQCHEDVIAHMQYDNNVSMRIANRLRRNIEME